MFYRFWLLSRLTECHTVYHMNCPQVDVEDFSKVLLRKHGTLWRDDLWRVGKDRWSRWEDGVAGKWGRESEGSGMGEGVEWEDRSGVKANRGRREGLWFREIGKKFRDVGKNAENFFQTSSFAYEPDGFWIMDRWIKGKNVGDISRWLDEIWKKPTWFLTLFHSYPWSQFS